MSDEPNHKGIDFALEQLCAFLGVDPHMVSWDAATETFGDVSAVIGNIMRAKYGEDFDPKASVAATSTTGDPLVGLDERLDRLCLTEKDTNNRFILSTESAKNIVGIVREWLRVKGGPAATPMPDQHDATYLRGWNEGIERAIELLDADGWCTPTETIRPLLDTSPHPLPEPAATPVFDDEDHMVKIGDLISRLQATKDQFGDTCVYIRRGGLSWGAVALNRRDDDKKHGVFDLQAQHDRYMLQRAEQVERLIVSKNEWMERATKAEASLVSRPLRGGE